MFQPQLSNNDNTGSSSSSNNNTGSLSSSINNTGSLSSNATTNNKRRNTPKYNLKPLKIKKKYFYFEEFFY